MLSFTSIASAEWLPEGWSTGEGTVYKNSTNGDIELWSKGEYVTKMTPKEFDEYSKIVEGYGKSLNDPSQVASTISQDAVNSTSGMTQVESEDVASIVLKARGDSTTITAGPLNPAETTAGIDLAGEDAGIWGTAGLAGGSAAAFGALTLGPAAFIAGLDIGKEIDQLFGFPSFGENTEEEEGKTQEQIELEAGEGKHLIYAWTESPTEEAEGFLPGYYWSSCEGNLRWNFCSPPNNVPTGGSYTTVVAKGTLMYLHCNEPSHNSGHCPGELIEHEPLAVPLGVPFPSPEGTPNVVPEPYRKNDTEHGINPNQDTEQVKPPERSKVFTKPEVGKVLTYEMQPGPAPSVEDLEKGDRNELTPHPRDAPIKEYLDKASPSPPSETGSTGTPAEPTAPQPSGPTLPGFKLPHFGVLCKGFPFGVPCWLVKTVESWSSSAKAPKWGIEEFSIKGHKIAGSSFDLVELEPIMEKARVAMLIFATIGLVMLFYRFARGGSPPSGGDIEDTGGDISD